MSHKPVRKAVFPIAGLGTRFLPATKVMAKEMLPLVDMPLVQNAVEEAKAAGIEEFIFVTSRGKSMIDDHFDLSAELLRTLEARGKTAEIEIAKGRRKSRQENWRRYASPNRLGPGPCRVVRARSGRQRALCGVAVRRCRAIRYALSEADDRRL